MQTIDTDDQRRQFVRQVLADLDALDVLLERGAFESGTRRVGLEQELNLVDDRWRPALVGEKVLQDARAAGVDNLVGEYARFNLEVNLPPADFGPDVLGVVRDRLAGDLAKVAEAAAGHGARVALVGILPSIRRYDIGPDALTPEPRYHMLFDATQRQKGGKDYEYHITGLDDLHLRDDQSVLGGTFTSLQLHWQVDPDAAGRASNWAQLLSGPQLAVAANAPIFLGKRLWQETRVALFEQTSDFRRRHETIDAEPPRVSFGTGWCPEGPGRFVELFREDALRHKAFMRCGDEDCDADPVAVAKGGGVPDLAALQFHNGTVYRWNRPCIGTGRHPHVRIENRVLAAGPTLADELANAALWWGLMAALPDLGGPYAGFADAFDFDDAHRNFLAAARDGMGVQFAWPGRDKPVPAQELVIDELLPIARRGLEGGGIDGGEIDAHLGVIRARTETGRTGARWLLAGFEALRGAGSSDDEALIGVTAAMVRRQEEGRPVHEWPPAQAADAGGWRRRLGRADEVMTRQPYTVAPDDVLDLAAHLIRWRKVGHVPVVEEGRLVGLLTGESILAALGRGEADQLSGLTVADVMLTDLRTVEPDAPTRRVVALVLEHGYSCLPVVEDGKLAGIITDGDLVRVLGEILEEESTEESQEEVEEDGVLGAKDAA